MESKLQLLAKKVEKVIDPLDRLKRENATLKSENAGLKTELAGIQKEYNELKLGTADRSDSVKTKLTSVLNRLEELENLHQ